MENQTEKQPIEVQTLYAELLERLVAFEAGRAIGHVAGSFVTKRVKGQDYCYFQHLGPGGAKRQIYIGRKDDVLDGVVRRYKGARRKVAADSASIQRLCSLLRAGGAITTDTASARVLRELADAGVFKLGGVLVGTHVFAVIANLLGVRWPGAAMRTQDVDIAAEYEMSVVLPDITVDVPAALDSLEMGFLPLPGLDPKSPSTSFKVRGQGLRVDLLAPARKGRKAPISVPRFSAAAQPLPFLDLLMEHPIRAALIDGGAVLVNVPDPGRFALHKLIVAAERPAAMHAKRAKDLRQAAQVLGVLVEERPGDVALAWDSVAARGRGWTKRVEAGLAGMARLEPEVAARVQAGFTEARRSRGDVPPTSGRTGAL